MKETVGVCIDRNGEIVLFQTNLIGASVVMPDFDESGFVISRYFKSYTSEDCGDFYWRVFIECSRRKAYGDKA